MIDVYVENHSEPPKDFTDSMYGALGRYTFEENNHETRQEIRSVVVDLFTSSWPEYPMGQVIVDTMGAYDITVTVKIDDIKEVNYECDYYIDYEAENLEDTPQEVADTADDILYGCIEKA